VQGAQGANVFELIIKNNYQMSFGGDYGKDTCDYVNAAKDAIATSRRSTRNYYQGRGK
jgi:hypothetical protein